MIELHLIRKKQMSKPMVVAQKSGVKNTAVSSMRFCK